jgi:hypothetical protein
MPKIYSLYPAYEPSFMTRADEMKIELQKIRHMTSGMEGQRSTKLATEFISSVCRGYDFYKIFELVITKGYF